MTYNSILEKMSNPEYATYSMIVAQLLNSAREALGMSQAQMLTSSGISQSSWSRAARGTSHLTLEELRSLCSTVKADPHEILSKADELSSALPKAEGIKILENLKGSENKSVVPSIIAGAALGFLIARLLSDRK